MAAHNSGLHETETRYADFPNHMRAMSSHASSARRCLPGGSRSARAGRPRDLAARPQRPRTGCTCRIVTAVEGELPRCWRKFVA